MKIKLKHTADFEKVILLIFLVNFGEGILSVFIPAIHPLYYVVDALNIILLIGIIGKRRFDKLLAPFFGCLFLFFALSVFGAIIHFSNIFLHLWGFRNVFSIFVFFIGCIYFEHSKNIDFLNGLFWLNCAVTIIELLLGYRQDWVGGIYGVKGGQVNGPLNLLLVIVTTKIVIEFFNRENKLYVVLTYGLFSIIIAAFAELKIFFFEIILIVFFASLITNFSYRKLQIIVVGFFGIILGICLLYQLFPDIDSSMFTIRYTWNYLTNSGGYTGQFANNAGDINRLAFWDKISGLFGNRFNQIFGLGLGNCDKIEVLGLQSDFYTNYNHLNYYMFPLPMILLQQGITGGVLYLGMFVLLFVAIKKRRDKADREFISICQMAEVLCLMAFVITIYDQSLQGRGAILYYYMLATPFFTISLKGSK